LTLLVPIIQYAALENDGDLAAKWAGLLATAAAGTPVHPIFPKVLSEITPPEARLLDALYVWEQESLDSEHNLVLEANLPENELPLICMNLGERLGLINATFTNFWKPDLTKFRNIRLTPLGTRLCQSLSRTGNHKKLTFCPHTQPDSFSKLLNEKGLITREKFLQQNSEERATYQRFSRAKEWHDKTELLA
jgi:hypothetical protein